VVTAQTTALEAERTGLLLSTRRQQTSVALFLALGGGWTVPTDVAETPLSTVDVVKQLAH
jgi:outer membrane protein TolC